MTRTSAFWAVFVALGLGGLATAVRLLPEGLDLVRDEIAMDRGEALAAAERLADLYDLPPAASADGRRAAASYGEEDPGVRSFVELERGGSEVYQTLVDDGIYVPSRWTVRLFASDSVAESWIEFTPAGWPHGFGITLSDDDPGGGNLDAATAEALARETAEEWDVDLTRFELVASSSDEAPSGRVDHEFVFRRLGVDLGEGEVGLRVRVAGNRPAGVYHSVEVPESFQLRYQEIRTGNDGIALVSSALFLVLFVLLGAGGGTLLLARERWLVVRPAMALGGIVGLGMALNGLNTIPLAWMQFDTTQGEAVFVGQLVATALVVGLAAAPLLGALFMAAESMGRKAFPGHLQQWRFWSRDVARSDTALGITLTGYLLAGLHLGYVTLFMLGTSRLEGWWSPPSNVIQPDLIATLQPWLLAVATNLFAATWEESVFRAIPLAGAALLGARFGRRGLWIGTVLVLQAVIFAAGHANYPQQPAYARVVELVGPALVWGLVYLRLGLVPTIFAHFFYNLYLTSIPLFQMSSPGIWLDRMAILAVAAIPLAVVVTARVRHGATRSAPADARNGAWSAHGGVAHGAGHDEAVRAEPDPAPDSRSGSSPPLEPPVPGAVFLPLGVALLVAATALVPDGGFPPASTTRAEAVTVAEAELRARGFDPSAWRPLADFTTGGGAAHEWVFEVLGRATYDRLLGSWLAAPRWEVRFVDFERAAEERVEEFRVTVSGDGGGVVGFEHTLPEGRPGPELDEEAARLLAARALDGEESIDPATLVEVAAEQNARPARRDWEFGFRVRDVLPDSLGEARVTVAVAGDEVTAVRRSIEPPEAWTREREAELNRVFALVIPVVLLVLGGGGFLVVTGVRLWTRKALEPRPASMLAAVTFVLLGATWLNGMPEVAASFVTALGWPLQLGGWLFGGLLFVTVGAGALGLAVAVARAWLPPERWRAAPVGLGVAAAGVAALLATLVDRFLAEPRPPVRAFDGVDHWFPPLTTFAGGLLEFVGAVAVLGFLGAFYRRAGDEGAVRVAFEVGVVLVAGTVVAVGWGEGAVGAVVAAGLTAMGLHAFGWLYANNPLIAVEAAAAGALASLAATALDPSFAGQALGAALAAATVSATAVAVLYSARPARTLGP